MRTHRQPQSRPRLIRPCCVGGLVGGWVEKEKAIRMSYCTYMGGGGKGGSNELRYIGWVGGWDVPSAGG